MWEECRKDDLEEKTKHIRLIPFFLCAESEKGVNILPEPEILCAVNVSGWKTEMILGRGGQSEGT